MDIRCKEFETHFAIQVAALTNNVLSAFETTEEGLKQQSSRIAELEAQLEKSNKEVERRSEQCKQLSEINQDAKAEIERLNQFIKDNGIVPQTIGEIPPQ